MNDSDSLLSDLAVNGLILAVASAILGGIFDITLLKVAAVLCLVPIAAAFVTLSIQMTAQSLNEARAELRRSTLLKRK